MARRHGAPGARLCDVEHDWEDWQGWADASREWRQCRRCGLVEDRRPVDAGDR
jgi:hypothetical protein